MREERRKSIINYNLFIVLVTFVEINKNMEKVKELLIIAFDEHNPEFQAAVQYLSDMQKDDPERVMPIFFEILQEKDINYQQVFLSLVVLRHCFQNSEIPISYGHPIVESTISDEFTKILFDISFNYFSHPHQSVRNAASSLCTTIFCTQWERLEEFNVISSLLGFITEISSIDAAASALQCLTTIISRENCPEEIKGAVLPLIFKLLQEHPNNVEIFSNSISLLCSCISIIGDYFENDEAFTEFLNHLISMLGNESIKSSIYLFFEVTFRKYPMHGASIFDSLIENIVNDLTNSKNEQLKHTIFNLLKSICSIEEGKKIDIVPKMIETILPIILQIMEDFDCEEVLDYQEWKPYTDAFFTLECFVDASGEIVLPMLAEFIGANHEDEDPKKREVCMKVFDIIFRVSDKARDDFCSEMLESSYTIITQKFEDPSPRVVYYAIIAINSLIRRFDNSSEQYLELFPPLLALISENLTINEEIFRVIKSIVSIQDFACYEAITNLIEAFSAFPVDQMVNWLMQTLIILAKETTDPTFIDQIIAFVFQFMQERAEGDDPKEVVSDLFTYLAVFIKFCSNELEEIVPQIIEFSFVWIGQELISTPLETVAALISKQFSAALEAIPNFIEVFAASLDELDNQDILIPAINTIGIVFTPEIFGENFIPLLDKIILLIRSGKGALIKSSVFLSINLMLMKGITGIDEQIAQILLNIDFLTGNIPMAYIQYINNTNKFLMSVASLLNTLLVITNPQLKKVTAEVCLKFITMTLIEDKYKDDIELTHALFILISKLFKTFPSLIRSSQYRDVIKEFIVASNNKCNHQHHDECEEED